MSAHRLWMKSGASGRAVEVDVTHKTDGTARPRKIKFEDGEVYEIDRVRHCCRAASTKVGGTGL